MTGEIILFDTEYTAWEGSQARKWSEPWEHREIIQIAAVRLALCDGEPETDRMEVLVKPKLNPELSPYIQRLTGIQQASVDQVGVSFQEAFSRFYDFCEQGRLPLFCWGDDPGVLRENFALNQVHMADFPAGMVDIRSVFEQVGIDTRQYTSGTVCQSVGVDLGGSAHNALNDVRSMAAALRYLRRTGQLDDAWVEGAMQRGRF